MGFDPSAAYILFGILGLAYFFISFFSIPVGLVIMAISMLFSPEITVGSIGVREITLRIEDLLIPILLVAWVAQMAVQKGLHGFVRSPLNLPILSLLVVSLFSTLNGIARVWVQPLEAIFYLGKTVEYFVIFFIVLNNVRTEKQIKYFLFFSILTLTLLGLYTLWQVPGTEQFSAHRITAPFEGNNPEPSTVGGYMAFFLLIVLSILLYADTIVMKWFFALLGILVFIPFLYTFSRTSYASFLGGFIVLAFLSGKKWLKFAILFFLLLSPVILPRPVKERIAFTWEDSKSPGRVMGVDYSFQERIFSLRRSLNVLKFSPLYGMGVASSQYIDNQYSRTIQELGLLGLGIWFWIYTRLFKIARWLHRYLTDGLFKGLALGYSAGVICILLHAMGSITFYVVRIMEPFWFVTGLVVSLYTIKIRDFSVSE